jgi:hypothetical protein
MVALASELGVAKTGMMIWTVVAPSLILIHAKYIDVRVLVLIDSFFAACIIFKSSIASESSLYLESNMHNRICLCYVVQIYVHQIFIVIKIFLYCDNCYMYSYVLVTQHCNFIVKLHQ